MTNVKNNKQISEILHKHSFDEVNKIRRQERKPELHADKHIVGNKNLGFYFLDPRSSYRSEISATLVIHNKGNNFGTGCNRVAHNYLNVNANSLKGRDWEVYRLTAMDAFRHTFASAYLNYVFSNEGRPVPYVIEEWHEIAGAGTFGEHNMDRYNNAFGAELGNYCRDHNLSLEEMAEMVKSAFDNGLIITNPYGEYPFDIGDHKKGDVILPTDVPLPGFGINADIRDPMSAKYAFNEFIKNYEPFGDNGGGGTGGGGAGEGFVLSPNMVEISIKFMSAITHHDPLVLDLDGDGIETIKLNDSNVYFDLDNDGFKEKSGWVSKDDGILIIDENNNGLVDGISELFGNTTINGFDELKLSDSNNDGKIDSQDANFSKIKIWQDLNENGISEMSICNSFAKKFAA